MAFDKGKYDMDYAKAHITRKHIPFNDTVPEDVELLAWLSKQENVTQYIKQLIRADIECSRCEYWNECTKCIYDGDSLSKRLSDRKRTRQTP